MLTFEQLQTFRAIVAARTFTRAADEMLLTQPAISQRVKRLEQALGTDIFDRRNKGREFRLTPAGERVLRFADEVVALLEQLQREIQREHALTRQETVTIVASSAAGKSLLPTLLSAYHERYPHVRVHQIDSANEKINAIIAGDEADIGVQISDWISPKFITVPLLLDHLVLVAPPNHPALTEPWHRAATLRESSFVLTSAGSFLRLVADEWATSQGIRMEIVLESQSLNVVKEAVVSGFGLTILPELWAVDDLRDGRLSVVPVAGLPREFNVCLIADAGHKLSPAARGLLDLAREGSWRRRMPALQEGRNQKAEG
jgi:DNA-binding transcriptional LysR family regulator